MNNGSGFNLPKADINFNEFTPPTGRSPATTPPTARTIDTTLVNEQPVTQPKKGKTKAPRSPVPDRFSISHKDFYSMPLVLSAFGLAVAQGIASKLDAETGAPVSQLYWAVLAIAGLTLPVIASKSGNQRLWLFSHQFSSASVAVPVATIALKFVFGS